MAKTAPDIETLDAEGAGYMQRLRGLVGKLVGALETVEVPADLVGIGRAARTTLAVGKLVQMFHGRDAKQEGEMMHGRTDGGFDAVDAWEHIFARKHARIAEARRAAGLAVDLAVDRQELTRQLMGMAKQRAHPASG